jgi:hypothetical protein
MILAVFHSSQRGVRRARQQAWVLVVRQPVEQTEHRVHHADSQHEGSSAILLVTESDDTNLILCAVPSALVKNWRSCSSVRPPWVKRGE